MGVAYSSSPLETSPKSPSVMKRVSNIVRKSMMGVRHGRVRTSLLTEGIGGIKEASADTSETDEFDDDKKKRRRVSLRRSDGAALSQRRAGAPLPGGFGALAVDPEAQWIIQPRDPMRGITTTSDTSSNDEAEQDDPEQNLS